MSYTYSLPVITLCTGKILQLKNPKTGASIAALMTLIPALGYASSKYAVALMDMNYLAKHQAAAHALRIFYVSMDGIGPILCACALAGWLLGGRKLSFLIGIMAVSTLLSEQVMRTAVVNLDHGTATYAAQLTLLCELARIVILFVGLLFIRQIKNRIEKGLFLITTLLGMWIMAPPLAIQLSDIPSGQARSDGPLGVPGLGVGMPSADPLLGDLDKQLNNQGSVRFNDLKWWCNPNPRADWTNAPRATAAISLPAQAQINILNPHLEELFSRGITQIAFVGRSKSHVSFSPLSQHLRNPAVRWITEPPPKNSFWGIVSKNGSISWVETPHRESTERIACAVWVDTEATIQHLFNIGQIWGGAKAPCAHGLFLLFGTPESDYDVWTPPLSCD